MAEWIALITALVLLAAAIIGLFVKVQQVHVLVNSRLTETLDRVDQLAAALQEAGIEVPDEPTGKGK